MKDSSIDDCNSKVSCRKETLSIPFVSQGLKETRHPYTFVSIEGFKDLLTVPDAHSKASPLLAKLAPSLRAALSSQDAGAFARGLTALEHLSNCVRSELNYILKVSFLILVPFQDFCHTVFAFYYGPPLDDLPVEWHQNRS